jgi:DNA-3-methyladenine glycosylase I
MNGPPPPGILPARCAWAAGGPPILTAYHDQEWGVPVHDDRRLFEFLILEGAQAGLSWLTILQRREGYRQAMDGLEPELVAGYGPAEVERLMGDPRVIRNRRKLESAVANAGRFLETAREFGSFDAYLWRFVGGEPRRNRWRSLREVPATSPESDALSRDLRRRGYSFVGSTIVYAFMQAVGMVDDHTVDCFRRFPRDNPEGNLPASVRISPRG